MYSKVFVVAAFLAAVVVVIHAQTTPTPEELVCNRQNATNCQNCTAARSGNSTGAVNIQCYWCGSTKACKHFTFNTAIPVQGIDCPQLRYNVGTCTLDVLAIIIIIAVACVLVVFLLCCCCCCCCILCASRRKKMKMKEDIRYADEKDSIRQRSSERRQERQAKHDEIRRKYGLNSEGGTDGNYQRF